MKITPKTLAALTPEAVQALKPNEILAAVLAAKIHRQTRGEDLIPKEAYKLATNRVKSQLSPEGGLKKEEGKVYPESILKLDDILAEAKEERGKSDTLINLAKFLMDGKKVPDEVRPLMRFVEPGKGFKKEIYHRFEKFPGFEETAKAFKAKSKEREAGRGEKQPQPAI